MVLPVLTASHEESMRNKAKGPSEALRAERTRNFTGAPLRSVLEAGCTSTLQTAPSRARAGKAAGAVSSGNWERRGTA